MKRLIRKILREHKSDKYYRFLDKISSIIEKPYFKNMYERFNGGFWDITDEDDQLYILKNIYGDDINIKDNKLYSKKSSNWNRSIYDDNGNILYREDSRGGWNKREYDDNGNMLYSENSNEEWSKYEYDKYGYMVYKESSDGIWYKREYNEYGDLIYEEHSDGSWNKWEYDEYGNLIYHEDSDGFIRDRR